MGDMRNRLTGKPFFDIVEERGNI